MSLGKYDGLWGKLHSKGSDPFTLRIQADRLPCLLYNKDLNAFWAERPISTGLMPY
jgi:hypothetical protein